MSRGPCEAVQYSDQMSCAKCGLAWDVNDHEPPECAPRTLQKGISTRLKYQNGTSRAQEILERLGL